MAQTKIPWATHSANPIRVKGPGKVWKHGYHCTKVSPGCAHCYAEAMNIMRGTGQPYDGRKMEYYLDLSVFDTLPKKPCMVFVQSMSDLFHKDIPVRPVDFQYEILCRMAELDQHIFILLTKRVDRMLWFFNNFEDWMPDENPHIWPGATVCNQEEADRIIPILLQVPAAKRIISIEPMLGAVNISEYLEEAGYESGGQQGWITTDIGIDWVILGAESGPKRRHCQWNWMQDIINQCNNADVPVFCKQIHFASGSKIMGDFKYWVSKDPSEWPPELQIRQYPEVV